MYLCDKLRKAAEEMFTISGREMKQLLKVREEIDSEWEANGVMGGLVRTGVLTQSSGELSKQGASMKSAVHTMRTMPPRSNVKRPASASATTERVFPKTGKFLTPGRLLPQRGVETCKMHPIPSTHGNSLLTPNFKSETPDRFSGKKTTSRSAPTNQVYSARLSRVPKREDTSGNILPLCPSTLPLKAASLSTMNGVISTPQKQINVAGLGCNLENISRQNFAVVETPKNSTAFVPSEERSSAVTFDVNQETPIMGTPVVNLLARTSPLSPEIVAQNGDVLKEIVSRISDTSTRHEQYLGIQALALFAKDHSRHPSWDENFPLVLNCLIGKL